MSKFLLNLLLQISKALVNSKIQFLIQKFFFLDFGPADLAAHPASQPSQPTGPSSSRVGRIFVGNMFSFSDHAFLSRPPPPSVTATRAPLVSFIVSPAPADPGQNFPHAAAPPCRCLAPWMPPSFYSSPSSLPPFNPLQTER
jgi:hypothetical protein